MLTNFRIEKSDNNTWLVRADSKRFGKQAIMFESWKRDDAVAYIKAMRALRYEARKQQILALYGG